MSHHVSVSPSNLMTVAKSAALASIAASSFILASCGGQKTKTANPRTDGYSQNDPAVESEFDRLQRELMGEGTAAQAGLEDYEDYSAALDSYFTDASNRIDEDDRPRQMNSGEVGVGTNSGLGSATEDQTGSVFDREDVELKPRSTRAKEGPAEETLPDRNLPRVSWIDAGTKSGKDETLTAADRLELAGSADDPTRGPDSDNSSALQANVDSVSEEVEDSSDISEDPGPRTFSRDELLVLLASRLHRDATYSQTPIREHLANASMMMLDKDRRIDPDELYDLNERERELLKQYQAFFGAIGRMLDQTRDPEILVDEANKLARSLGSHDLLEIPNFKLCTSVRKFGTYEESELTQFIRGRRHEVIAYVEVANFKPKLSEDGEQYKSVLTQETELYTASDGTVVFRQPAATATDECRNHRKDFYLVRHVELPSNLNVGSYYLKVRVRDEHTQQEAEAVIPIEIVASS